MILDSKVIPYEAIDITEPGKEGDKEFMLNNAKARGESTKIFSPQIFNGESYCGVSKIKKHNQLFSYL